MDRSGFRGKEETRTREVPRTHPKTLRNETTRARDQPDLLPHREHEVGVDRPRLSNQRGTWRGAGVPQQTERSAQGPSVPLSGTGRLQAGWQTPALHARPGALHTPRETVRLTGRHATPSPPALVPRLCPQEVLQLPLRHPEPVLGHGPLDGKPGVSRALTFSALRNSRIAGHLGLRGPSVHKGGFGAYVKTSEEILLWGLAIVTEPPRGVV